MFGTFPQVPENMMNAYILPAEVALAYLVALLHFADYLFFAKNVQNTQQKKHKKKRAILYLEEIS